MTKTEEKLIEKGYRLKKKYNAKEPAHSEKKQYQEKGFKAQVLKTTENDTKVFKLYVKK